MGQVLITYIGHSCFAIDRDGYRVILDPYQNGSVPGYADLTLSADLVLASHRHGDHFGMGNVMITEPEKEEKRTLGQFLPEGFSELLPEGDEEPEESGDDTIVGNLDLSPWEITEIHSFHDPERGAIRGENTIRILSDGEYSIAHLGDIGCMPAEEDLELLRGVDVLMVPVGGYFTMEPASVSDLVKAIDPVITVPMHYRGEDFGYEVIAPLSTFLAGREDVVLYEGSTLNLPMDHFPQTAVLRPAAVEGTQRL